MALLKGIFRKKNPADMVIQEQHAELLQESGITIFFRSNYEAWIFKNKCYNVSKIRRIDGILYILSKILLYSITDLE